MNKPECVTLADGTKRWHLNGILHREDGPAVEYLDGKKYWFQEGVLHREDGPAVTGGSVAAKEWWIGGQLHREDGPAVERTDGGKMWWLNGEFADPETIVDLWLMRGKFCFYDKVNGCLNFG